MVARYIRIRYAIRQIDGVDELVPCAATHKKLVALHAELEKLDTVCMALQHERTTVADVRLLFDSVVADYPVMGEYLRPNAKIVHSPLFESALVKIGNGDTLSTAEARAIKCFQAASDCEDKGEGAKRPPSRRRSRARSNVRYRALAKLVPPTSNTVERLFSSCKLITTPHRSCMLPANFVTIAFLRVNREMWNAASLIEQGE
ncbi:hypothetical protein F443_10618 [Phytophthora nicotianae P1569]|uniref:HAT C-terminal dimerisation domain-containing protein n=1 Tax=Phytophthora nicotianae P1569 TaxID=1317065 RepID=V9F0T1_PHYNI|nr:hypothetical protein F443_10618 [Phytophthora nicotianae P1569]